MKNRKIVIVALLVIAVLIVIVILWKKPEKVEQTNANNGESIAKEEDVSGNDLSFLNDIKDEIITAENYEEVMSKIGNEWKDEAYYFTYACLYYVAKDGMAAAFSNPDDKEAMYVRVYGKSVKQLIEEGKQLMQENDMTVEKYKQSLQNLAENQ